MVVTCCRQTCVACKRDMSQATCLASTSSHLLHTLQWLFFQNVIQVQPHGGKNPIVLYQEMWLQVFRHVSLQRLQPPCNGSTGQVPRTELLKTIAIHRNTHVHLLARLIPSQEMSWLSTSWLGGGGVSSQEVLVSSACCTMVVKVQGDGHMDRHADGYARRWMGICIGQGDA